MISLAVALVSASPPAWSAPLTPPAESDRDEVLTLAEAAALLEVDQEVIAALAEQGEIPGRRLGREWRFSRRGLLEWLAATPGEPDEMPTEPLSDADLQAARAAGPDAAPSEAETVGEPPPDETASDIFLRSRRILLAPGQLVIEPLFFYTRSDTPDIQFQSFASSDGLPISAAVGQASNIEQNITSASLTGRIGLVEGTELFSGLIFQDRRIKSETEDEKVDTELRSVFLGLRGAVLEEGPYRPSVVLGVQGIGPLGDSSPAVNATAYAVKSADPLALFLGLEYQHTFSHDFDEPRKLEPEDTFGAQIGYVFAVTDQSSLSAAIQALFVLDSSFDSQRIDSAEEFSLRLGLTQRLRRDLYVEPSVAFSLNGPGDFVTFGLRLPWIVDP